MKQHIEAAYGIRGSQSKSIDDSHELADTFKSLYPGLDLQPPAASSLKGALEDLLGQALSFEFPAHPSFGAEIKSLHLRKVYDEVIKAVSEKGGRVLVEKSVRSLVKQIAEPLNLGEQGETHFVLGQRWKDHFTRKAAESGAAMTVQALRKWIDEPRSHGPAEGVRQPDHPGVCGPDESQLLPPRRPVRCDAGQPAGRSGAAGAAVAAGDRRGSRPWSGPAASSAQCRRRC